ncbi:MAG: AprI/Inh family metalloprotease inhibitor [Devosia sp.]
MMRFVSGRVRLALVLVALTAAPVFAQDSSASSEPQSTVPPELQGMVGDFILEQEDESLPKCPLTLTDQETIGGWAVEVPETCPAPYPAADQFLAWNIDPNDGSVIFLNAERKVTMRLFEDEDGLYDTDPAVEPRFYLLSPYDEDGTGGEADGGDAE